MTLVSAVAEKLVVVDSFAVKLAGPIAEKLDEFAEKPVEFAEKSVEFAEKPVEFAEKLAESAEKTAVEILEKFAEFAESAEETAEIVDLGQYMLMLRHFHLLWKEAIEMNLQL